MRLLNTSTLELHPFLSATHEDTPKYAILSHTWGDEEILFEDVRDGPHTIPRHKKGFAKVAGSARHAKIKGFDWIWIDTCCIDKSSSAELSEAINSMFLWYRRAQICFAYLSDVRSPKDLPTSRWFTRGWTLQELIAPLEIEFIDSVWQHIGTRKGLATSLSGITGIDAQLLAGVSFMGAYSISARMAWASGRQTTRKEDMAYSLLGIFNVTMPLIYGEGQTSAFRRLQEEIIKTSSDQSIFAFRQYWFRKGKNGDPPRAVTTPMTHYLASSPLGFREGGTILDDDPYDKHQAALHPITLHPHGVTFRAMVGPATYYFDEKKSMKAQLVILNCCFQNDPLARPAFLVTDFGGLLARLESALLRALPSAGEGAMCIQSEGWGPGPGPGEAWVVAGHADEFAEQMITISEPPRDWSPERTQLRLCRLTTTSQLFSARQELRHSIVATNDDYLSLESVFGHLGTIIVTGPGQDEFYVMWGYGIDSSSPEFKVYGTNRLQFFGRRSVDAWKNQTPRLVIAEIHQPQLQPGTSQASKTMVVWSALGDVCSPEVSKTWLSLIDLPSWTISRRPSGLVVRVEACLRTFLNRTCVEVEISDCPPDSEEVSTPLKPVSEKPTDAHREDSQPEISRDIQTTGAE